MFLIRLSTIWCDRGKLRNWYKVKLWRCKIFLSILWQKNATSMYRITRYKINLDKIHCSIKDSSKPSLHINHSKIFFMFPSLSELACELSVRSFDKASWKKKSEASYPEVACMFFALKYWLCSVFNQNKPSRSPRHLHRLS